MLASLAILASALSLLPPASSVSVFRRWDTQCESFKLPPVPENINATLARTKYYPAGALFNETDPNASFKSSSLTAFCRVIVNITTSPTSKAISEIWLPDKWNERFLGLGNGASGGGCNLKTNSNQSSDSNLFQSDSIVAWSEMGYAGINQGFAAHATNGGHSSNGSSAVFAINNPESLTDWNYRAMHQGTVVAKAVIASYFNQPKFLSYYGSCSAGGRQGWMEAERYPEDYDAIIVGSPGLDDVRQSASALWVNQKVLPVNGSTWFSNHTWSIVHNEVLKQCDGIDGVVDGVLNNPLRCNFRPEAIACRPWETNTTDCLTFDQLQTLRYIYEPWVDTNDTYVYAGFPVGGELGFIAGNLLPDGGQYGQDGDFYRHIVYNDSSWMVDQISYASVQLALNTIAPGDSATNPDISKFVARGGKLIQYVGWQDKYISPLESIHWHQVVDRYMTTHTNYTTEDYFRLFIVPGMGHCAGGNGPNTFGQPSSYTGTPPLSQKPSENAIFSLVQWLEKGIPPTQYTGTSYHNNNKTLGVSYQRPICMWPKTAVYKGGDENKVESFACEL